MALWLWVYGEYILVVIYAHAMYGSGPHVMQMQGPKGTRALEQGHFHSRLGWPVRRNGAATVGALALPGARTGEPRSQVAQAQAAAVLHQLLVLGIQHPGHQREKLVHLADRVRKGIDQPREPRDVDNGDRRHDGFGRGPGVHLGELPQLHLGPPHLDVARHGGLEVMVDLLVDLAARLRGEILRERLAVLLRHPVAQQPSFGRRRDDLVVPDDEIASGKAAGLGPPNPLEYAGARLQGARAARFDALEEVHSLHKRLAQSGEARHVLARKPEDLRTRFGRACGCGCQADGCHVGSHGQSGDDLVSDLGGAVERARGAAEGAIGAAGWAGVQHVALPAERDALLEDRVLNPAQNLLYLRLRNVGHVLNDLVAVGPRQVRRVPAARDLVAGPHPANAIGPAGDGRALALHLDALGEGRGRPPELGVHRPGGGGHRDPGKRGPSALWKRGMPDAVAARTYDVRFPAK